MLCRPLLVLTAALAYTASATLVVTEGKLALIDTVGATAVTSTSFTSVRPAPLSETPLSATDTLKLSFVVRDEHDAPIQPHQAMISFVPVDPTEQSDYGRQWAGLVKVRQNGKARWELDLSRAPTGLLSLSSGQISATLLLGAPHHDGLSVPLGTFTLSPSLSLPFPYPPNEDLPSHWEVEKYAPQPEIQWTFKQGEKQVNAVVAVVGLGVVLSPWIVFVAILSYLVPSLSLRRPSPSQAVLLVSIVAFEVLFVTYWIDLRLIPTLPYFAALGVVTVLSGKRALGEMRRTRRDRERSDGGKTE